MSKTYASRMMALMRGSQAISMAHMLRTAAKTRSGVATSATPGRTKRAATASGPSEGVGGRPKPRDFMWWPSSAAGSMKSRARGLSPWATQRRYLRAKGKRCDEDVRGGKGERPWRTHA